MFGKKSESQIDFEIFTIYDSKSQSYGVPVLEKNHLVLIREITNLMQKDSTNPPGSQSPYFLNPEDYSIFRIGTFSKADGKLTTMNLEHVANLHDLKAMVVSRNSTSAQEMGIVRT